MAELRNLNELTASGRRVFDIPYIGYTGAEIIARAAAATGDVGPGLLNNDGLTGENRYSLRVTYSTIPPADWLLRADGSGYVLSYGTLQYEIYETVPGGTMTRLVE